MPAAAPAAHGGVAEWLGKGLQNPVHRFNSGPRLEPIACTDRALSSGGERFLDAEEVRGSNPLAPTSKATMNDTGRSGAFEGPSLACQAEVPPARGPVRSRIPLEEGP